MEVTFFRPLNEVNAENEVNAPAEDVAEANASAEAIAQPPQFGYHVDSEAWVRQLLRLMALATWVIVCDRNSGVTRIDNHQVELMVACGLSLASTVCFAIIGAPRRFGRVGNPRWASDLGWVGYLLWWGGLCALGVGVLLYDADCWYGRIPAILTAAFYSILLPVFFSWFYGWLKFFNRTAA